MFVTTANLVNICTETCDKIFHCFGIIVWNNAKMDPVRRTETLVVTRKWHALAAKFYWASSWGFGKHFFAGLLLQWLVAVLGIRIRTYVFEPPGSASGSVNHKYESGSGSSSGLSSGPFHHQAKLVRKTLIYSVLWLLNDFLPVFRIRIGSVCFRASLIRIRIR